MRVRRIVVPTTWVLTLQQAATQCRIDDDLLADTEIESQLLRYVAQAQGVVESYLGASLTAQRWRLTLDGYPDGELPLLRPPIVSIESHTYVDADDQAQSLIAGIDYYIDLDGARLLPADSWPATGARLPAVAVEYNAGIDAEAAPELQMVVQVIVGQLWDGGGVVGDGASHPSWRALLAPFTQILEPHRDTRELPDIE